MDGEDFLRRSLSTDRLARLHTAPVCEVGVGNLPLLGGSHDWRRGGISTCTAVPENERVVTLANSP